MEEAAKHHKQMVEEGIKGSLTPGKLADVTVLSKDILTVPDEEIRSVRLESTTAVARAFASPALCGMPAPQMQVDPQGRSATVRLAPGSVHVIDVPAGNALKVEELS